MAEVRADALPIVDLALDDREGLCWVLFRSLSLRLKATHSRRLRWTTDAQRPPSLGRVVASARVHGDIELAVRDDGLYYLSLGGGQLAATVAASNAEHLDVIERDLRAAVPPADPRALEGAATFEFWCRGQHSANSYVRTLAVDPWAEIRANYSAAVAEAIDRLALWRPTGSGQLLLWHGAPGTGKTHVLRALAWEWRGWCDVHVVVDPETFFGSRPDYMLEVLLDDDDQDKPTDLSDGNERSERWRLLVLEDAGELLAADAKEQAGQGISRLLNLADGLIGQGLRILILVTGNEPLRSLHPALSRPGRCASLVEFGLLSVKEAQEWLDARDFDAEAPGPLTLSSLYALLAGHQPPVRRPVGFAPAVSATGKT